MTSAAVNDPLREAHKSSTTGITEGSAQVKIAYLSPSQLTKLKSGPRVHIFVGPAKDQFVGVEGAYTSVLAHYSKYAKTKLLTERVPGLVIVDGTKTPVKWIYKYMLAGENDPEGLEKFDDLSIADLVLVYSHCAVLEYQGLMDRILVRLHGKLYHSLPDVPTIKNIAIFAPSVNKLVAKAIARHIVQPLTFEYGPYMQHALEDEEFSSSVGAMVQDTLERRIATGSKYYTKEDPNRYVKWSNEYYRRKSQRSAALRGKKQAGVNNIADLKPEITATVAKREMEKKVQNVKKTEQRAIESPKMGGASPTFNKRMQSAAELNGMSEGTNGGQAGQETAAPSKRKRVNRPRCRACKERGHTRRTCPTYPLQEVIQKGPSAARVVADTPAIGVQHDCEAQGPASTIKKGSKGAPRSPPVCFACNEDGHIARNCPAPPAAYIQQKLASRSNANGVFNDISNQPRVFYARNKDQRRAKAERMHCASTVDSGNMEH